MSETTVCVGSGSGNSHDLVVHKTSRRETEDMVFFTFWIDDIKVKRAEFLKDKRGKLTHLRTYFLADILQKQEIEE